MPAGVPVPVPAPVYGGFFQFILSFKFKFLSPVRTGSNIGLILLLVPVPLIGEGKPENLREAKRNFLASTGQIGFYAS